MKGDNVAVMASERHSKVTTLELRLERRERGNHRRYAERKFCADRTAVQRTVT